MLCSFAMKNYIQSDIVLFLSFAIFWISEPGLVFRQQFFRHQIFRHIFFDDKFSDKQIFRNYIFRQQIFRKTYFLTIKIMIN